MKKQLLLNTYVNDLSMDEVIQRIENLAREKKKSYIVPINVDVVLKIENNGKLKEVVSNAEMVLVDGKPLIWISGLLGRPVKHKISGSDLVPALCASIAGKGYTLFILGGKEGVAEQARMNMEKKYPGIQVIGTYAPPFGFEKNSVELRKINDMLNEKKPDILIACLGCPKQELWVYDNFTQYGATVSICAGATVDFMAGTKKRAPRWMRNVGLEWFFRFLQEPKRMFKRYFIDDIKILKLMIKYK